MKAYRFQIHMVPDWVVQTLRVGYPPFTPLGTPLSKGLSWGRGVKKMYRAAVHFGQFGGYQGRGWHVVLTNQYGAVYKIQEVKR